MMLGKRIQACTIWCSLVAGCRRFVAVNAAEASVSTEYAFVY